MGKQTRAKKRVELSVQVQVESDSQLQRFYSKNISGGGLFLEMENFLPLGDEVSLAFTVPGRPLPIKVNAKVVRHHVMQSMDAEMNPKALKGVGLAFVDLSAEDQAAIESFIHGKGLAVQG